MNVRLRLVPLVMCLSSLLACTYSNPVLLTNNLAVPVAAHFNGSSWVVAPGETKKLRGLAFGFSLEASGSRSVFSRFDEVFNQAPLYICGLRSRIRVQVHAVDRLAIVPCDDDDPVLVLRGEDTEGDNDA